MRRLKILLLTACKNHFGSSDNVKVSIDPETCEFHVFQEKTVVETVEDPVRADQSGQCKDDQFQI